MRTLALCVLTAGSPARAQTPTPHNTPGTNASNPASEPRDSSAEPTLRQKIGQMIMVGFRGTSLAEDATVMHDIHHRHLGGVVLYNRDVPTDEPVRNIEDATQLRALIAQLQRAAPGPPLLVAVDQEGGRVRRLGARFGFAARSTAAHFGRINDPARTETFALETARTLINLGINLNFAPVVDLDDPHSPVISKHGRSYGSDPDQVVQHARAFIRGHRTHGVLTALKHFPGHGSARDDSHHGLPDITRYWKSVELEPFRRLITGGLADSVMTAHLYHRELDPDHPATLSRQILGVLRHSMHYQGVIISDDLQMQAIRNHYDEARALELAIEAGVDVLMFSNNTIYDDNVAERVMGSIERSIKRGRIDPGRIDESYARINVLKKRLAKSE